MVEAGGLNDWSSGGLNNWTAGGLNNWAPEDSTIGRRRTRRLDGRRTQQLDGRKTQELDGRRTQLLVAGGLNNWTLSNFYFAISLGNGEGDKWPMMINLGIMRDRIKLKLAKSVKRLGSGGFCQIFCP
ncbi:hypothetical protein AVEN_69503-1 [Araneus ventricosus]|uniref:Uncharacterized protein n=1 Tax=Araneus ventricosus TaxID=182803 RepID=A0A4Y2QY52_ARAVE|nr:hypothetical protein AVEN_69503-1 [Araneus ventricosus]